MDPAAPTPSIIVADITVIAGATQTDTIEVETTTTGRKIIEKTMIEEMTTTREMRVIVATTIIAGKTPTEETTIEGIRSTAAIMISAPTTKNAPTD